MAESGRLLLMLLGFQSQEPSLDFSTSGILALNQLYRIIHHNRALATAVITSQALPLVSACISVSQMILNMLQIDESAFIAGVF